MRISWPESVLHMSATEHGLVTALHVAHIAGEETVQAHNVVVRIHAASWRGMDLRRVCFN